VISIGDPYEIPVGDQRVVRTPEVKAACMRPLSGGGRQERNVSSRLAFSGLTYWLHVLLRANGGKPLFRYSPRRRAMTAICAFETFERRLESTRSGDCGLRRWRSPLGESRRSTDRGSGLSQIPRAQSPRYERNCSPGYHVEAPQSALHRGARRQLV
jgi:hypothetical protein